MKKIYVAIATFVVLQGCGVDPVVQAEVNNLDARNRQIYAATPAADADYGTTPKDVSAQFKKYLEPLLKDPYSAQWSEATPPKKEYIFTETNSGYTFYPHITPEYGYSACITVNAKNSYGGYTGNKTYWAFFKNGIINKVAEAYPGEGKHISELDIIAGRGKNLSNQNPKPFIPCN